MTSLGEIVLKFGATGAEGEEPLRFKTAHINLLVGPNNAGKSLMLREISGVNPRGRQRQASTATRIVEAVHWADAVAQRLQDQIVDEVFAKNESVWGEIKTRSWGELIPALERAVPQLAAIRDDLCGSLLELAGPRLAEWKEIVVALVKEDRAGAASLIIGVAVILLQLAQLDAKRAAAKTTKGSGDMTLRRAEPLTGEEMTVIRRSLEGAWERAEQVFRSLRVETKELSLADLLDTNAFGGALLMEMRKNSLLNMIIAREPTLSEHAAPNAAALERVERFTRIGGWLLDPRPLEILAELLQERFAENAWSHPTRRAAISKAVLYLDGMARLSVTRSAELKSFDAKDAQDQPVILSLLRKPELMELLRELTADALDGYLVADMATEGSKVIWRLAEEEPPPGLENSWSAEAHRFHAAAVRLDERSDGIHAFVGMLAAILGKFSDLVFIDEPEAFLHPPLVRRFARQISRLAMDKEIQFFIATHSADLLETFVACGAEVNIIRLTHDSERSTARLLESADVRYLARDPLLRSEATLSALFHEGAVICEAAGDRVLYKEINERLLAEDEDALDSCVFLNAQNWDTIPRMMAPLRRMGVAAAAIVDADVLFEPGLTILLDAAQVNKVLRDGWIRQRDGLREKIAKRLGVDLKGSDDEEEAEPGKDKGKKKQKLPLKGTLIAEMKPSEKKIFSKLLSSVAEYGVFLVPVGELENWLSPLGLRPPSDRTKKAKWLRDALNRLGQDPRDENYVRPSDGDIWDFVRSVNAWILDPEREGTSPTPHQDD